MRCFFFQNIRLDRPPPPGAIGTAGHIKATFRAPGSPALRPRPCAACAARALRSPGALCRGLSALQNSLFDRPVAGLLLFKIALFDRPAAGLLLFKKPYMTATQQNQKNASQTDENVSACFVPQARPRARVSGLAASTLRRLRGARPMRSPGALCRGLSAFQNSLSDRPVANLLLFEVPCLTARSWACLFSECLIRPPCCGLAFF